MLYTVLNRYVFYVLKYRNQVREARINRTLKLKSLQKNGCGGIHLPNEL